MMLTPSVVTIESLWVQTPEKLFFFFPSQKDIMSLAAQVFSVTT